MEWNIESIIFYILLGDSIAAVITAFCGGRTWWERTLPKVATELPITRGWALLYHVLVLFIGYILASNHLLTKFW